MYKHATKAAACAAMLALMGAAQAPADQGLELISKPGEHFKETVATSRAVDAYRDARADARKAHVKTGEDVLGEDGAAAVKLRAETKQLRKRVRRAKPELSGGSVAGVSQSTLETIAACESGGNPTAVNAAGYYGKYQFDTGTWASVGGSGNPAEAPEAEQDYRAALLYSRSSSSPWPVCGV